MDIFIYKYPFLADFLHDIIAHFEYLNEEIKTNVIKCKEFCISDYQEEIDDFIYDFDLQELILNELRESLGSTEIYYRDVDDIIDDFYGAIDEQVFAPLNEEYCRMRMQSYIDLALVLREKDIIFGCCTEAFDHFAEYL